MGITFNADEIFEIAEEIERNGAGFYREAAKIAPDDETKKMLLALATVEDGHLKTFEEMRKDLGEREKEETVFDPNNEAAMYLRVMADSRGTEGKISPTLKLTGNETVRDILEIAVNAEKESVVFYTGMKDFVPVTAGRDKIEAIITEEIGHIAMLKEKLKAASVE